MSNRRVILRPFPAGVGVWAGVPLVEVLRQVQARGELRGGFICKPRGVKGSESSVNALVD